MTADRSIGPISAGTLSSPAPPAPTPAPRADLLASFGPLVIVIRWGTVAIGVALAALDSTEPRRLLAAGVPLVVYAALRTVRPLRYLTRRIESLIHVLVEVGLSLGVVVFTGFWASPYVFSLVTAILAAGLARGFGFALRTATTAVIAVAIPYHLEDPAARVLDTVQWATELLLVGVVAGYARRLFGEAEEQTLLARQANDLLAQLHEVAQTLPTSLDLTETVADAITDLRRRFPVDVVAVLLRDDAGAPWSVAAAEGVRLAAAVEDSHLPASARTAAREQRTVRADEGPFLSAGAVAGVYVPLEARARPVGLLAIETVDASRLTAREVAEAEAVAHRAALAIDNARWFTLLRRVGADEERTRIARDLHDRVGQSLAFVGFELDRISRAASGQAVEDDLLRLREDVRQVVADVRDTLYDLRTDVTERQGLAATLEGFVDRIAERSRIVVELDSQELVRLPIRQERELWRIAQEAITNAVRHARPHRVSIRWHCDGKGALLEVSDDGAGMPPDEAVRPDAYGVRGMRERAAAIGARLTITPVAEGGTRVRCEVRT
ncbi:MAG TPA: histidine kinase [Acidimicrobiales bacterium]